MTASASCRDARLPRLPMPARHARPRRRVRANECAPASSDSTSTACGRSSPARGSSTPTTRPRNESRHRMIIDCHGHYTTAPAAHQRFRDAQIARLEDPAAPPPVPERISDDEIRESIDANQLKLQRLRGSDFTLFSPRAAGMGHHIGDESVSISWTRANNELVKRVADLYPENFAGVCQLPQSPGVPIAHSTRELEHCVRELGFVGCNLNPDPSGGHWTSPPLTDRSWYPFYEKMVELDVPAMVHVSASCNPSFHATGAHYLNADTTAFMQFIQGDLFKDFPTLRFIIPHGGGAVPYH